MGRMRRIPNEPVLKHLFEEPYARYEIRNSAIGNCKTVAVLNYCGGPIMPFSEANLKKIAFYEQHYKIVADLPLVAKAPIKLCDHEKNSERRCRFCGKSEPEVSFRNKAHAVPELLGNKCLISMNECDACNEFFASDYEDHLAKWFGPMRSLCQMQGKKGTPKYKSDEFTAERGDKGMKLFVKSDSSRMNIKEGSSGTFKIPVEMKTQPYIPVRAAKAFIKSAISVLPKELLSECENTILWLLGKTTVNIDKFPVLYAFTPGVNPYKNGKVMIFRRKSHRTTIFTRSKIFP